MSAGVRRDWYVALVDPPRLWRAWCWAFGLLSKAGDPSYTRMMIAGLALLDARIHAQLGQPFAWWRVALYMAGAFGRHSFDALVQRGPAADARAEPREPREKESHAERAA
jgi:hypothetical protein